MEKNNKFDHFMVILAGIVIAFIIVLVCVSGIMFMVRSFCG